MKLITAVAIDLTPILPGGENGGAKVFVLELVRRLAASHLDTQFILLTQFASHAELSCMDNINITRQMVLGPRLGQLSRLRRANIAGRLLKYLSTRYDRIAAPLVYGFSKLVKRRGSRISLGNMGIDLLFCPFTAPTYFDPNIPTVCTVYDLQYTSYPEFFTSEEVAHRHQTFVDACRRATVLTAISNYSREVAIQQGNLTTDRICTVYLRMAQRISFRQGKCYSSLDQLGLSKDRYLIYPANFWRHKNHEMLVAAFGIACKTGLPPDIKLVFTGALSERQAYLISAVAAMELESRIVFANFLPDNDLAVLLFNARGLVFPSLYEGFGLPIVEAMQAGIPVACSNCTALPEVADEAAILFDPRIPTQIAEALITLVEDDTIRSRLIAAGRKRAMEFSDSERMAREYWDLFLSAINHSRQSSFLSGVYEDGWCGPELFLQLTSVDHERTLELELVAPSFLPDLKLRITVTTDDNGSFRIFEFARGDEGCISIPLSIDVTEVRIKITPTFVPLRYLISRDSRELTLQLRRCSLYTANGSRCLLSI